MKFTEKKILCERKIMNKNNLNVKRSVLLFKKCIQFLTPFYCTSYKLLVFISGDFVNESIFKMEYEQDGLRANNTCMETIELVLYKSWVIQISGFSIE